MCPVTALLGYLAIRLKRSGPLFIFHDGSTLSRERLVSSLRQVLSDVGTSAAQYSGHSFRIGAATTAAELGVPDSLIKKMGRWKLSVFMHYIRTPWQQLAGASAEGQSMTHFQHVLLTPRFVRMVDLIYVIISSGMSRTIRVWLIEVRGG